MSRPALVIRHVALCLALVGGFLPGTVQAQITLTWNQDGPTNVWDTTTANWVGGATFSTGDLTIFDSVGETVSVAAGGVVPGSTTISSGTWRFEGGGIGSGSFTHSGTGTTVLTQANGFSAASLTAGTVRIQNASALGSGPITQSGGRLFFSFGDGTDTAVANDIALAATGYQTFSIRGTDGLAPTTETTVRLTGVLSGGTAGQIYRLVDSDTSGNMNNYLILDNPTNSFSGVVEIFRGYLGITSDAALGSASIRSAVGGTGGFNGGIRFAADNVVIPTSREIVIAANDVIDTGAFTATIANLAQSGDRTFRKTGSGTLVINGTSSVLNTQIQSGTLQVGDGGATGELGSGTITNDATLAFNRSDDFSFNNRVDGASGGMVKLGAGTMTIGANTDNKNSSFAIDAGRVVSQKGGRYFMIGHLVGGNGLPNGATITIASGATLDLDGDRNLDGDVGYALDARGNAQVTLNGGSFNLVASGSARSNIVGTITANGGGSVAIGSSQRLDLNNSGGITTTGSGGLTMNGAGSLNLAIRNTTGSSPVFNVATAAPLSIEVPIESIAVGTSLGGLGFEKTGPGTLTLAAANTYTGNTLVSAGTLAVTGSIASSSLTTVASGATLAGSGSLAATLIQGGGFHAPGTSPGIQTITNGLEYQAAATLTWELFDNTALGRGTAYDGIDLTGGSLVADPGAVLALDFGTTAGGSTVNWTNSFWDNDQSWTIIDVGPSASWDGSLFGLLAVGPDAAGQSLASVRPSASFSVASVDGDLTLQYAAVPEPGAVALTGLGLLAALAGMRQRRRG
jgi:autotransporter-associated beta strand protein